MPSHTWIVAFDCEPASQHALVEGYQMLVRLGGGKLIVAMVLRPDASSHLPGDAEQSAEAALARARANVDHELAHLPPATVEVRTWVGGGYPAEAIAALARETHADVIVCGTHNRKGVARFLVGSVAARIAQESPCSVLIIKPS